MKTLSSQTGTIFRKEPAGYVKIIAFVLLGYLPVLAVSGIAGGVLTGLAAALLIRRIPEF